MFPLSPFFWLRFCTPLPCCSQVLTPQQPPLLRQIQILGDFSEFNTREHTGCAQYVPYGRLPLCGHGLAPGLQASGQLCQSCRRVLKPHQPPIVSDRSKKLGDLSANTKEFRHWTCAITFLGRPHCVGVVLSLVTNPPARLCQVAAEVLTPHQPLVLSDRTQMLGDFI